MLTNKNRLHELQIACAVRGTSIAAIAREWQVSDVWVRKVAEGSGRSDRIEKLIDDFIATAKKDVRQIYRIA